MKIFEDTIRTINYVLHRKREIKEIKNLLSLGEIVTYSHRDTWVKIGNKVFNGFNRKEIEGFIEENGKFN